MDVVVAYLITLWNNIFWNRNNYKYFDLYENCRCFFGCFETNVEYHNFTHIVMVYYLSRVQEVRYLLV